MTTNQAIKGVDHYLIACVNLGPVVQVDIVALVLHDGWNVLSSEQKQASDGEGVGGRVFQDAHSCKRVLPHIVYSLQEASDLRNHVYSTGQSFLCFKMG